ncbi:hypothetical protein OSB04_027990 [Centaurea solstitialis]|uniref:DUF659 domain-containing protein n=1 Tax=Centaurea solstitialis TaxID=347529 RepID=A0AA38SEN4_9ASTR|nr:hypothetical protein OSB04_027990 [Centaurea solstitialis]
MDHVTSSNTNIVSPTPGSSISTSNYSETTQLRRRQGLAMDNEYISYSNQPTPQMIVSLRTVVDMDGNPLHSANVTNTVRFPSICRRIGIVAMQITYAYIVKQWCGMRSESKPNPKFSICCNEGKVTLPFLQHPPQTLRGLLDYNGEQRSKSFRQNIKLLNAMFSFTSMGGNINTSGFKFVVITASSSASTPSSTSMPSSTSKRMRKNASGARTDAGWEHGLDIGGRKVKCKCCDNVYSGEIFRFKHHIARTHQNVGPCSKVPKDVKAKFLNLLEENEISTKKRRDMSSIGEVQEGHDMTKGMDSYVSKKGKGQITMNAMFKKDEQERVRQQIARGLDPPSYHEMKVTCLKKEVDYTKALLDKYKQEWKKTGCTLMSDGWTDRKHRSICNFLVNSPKGEELLRLGATRFATSYLTLSRLYDQKSALILMFASEKWVNSSFARSKEGINVENIILDKLFWGSVLSCLKAAIPMVHSKRRNRLHQQKMNDLVYVMYNIKLSKREENHERRLEAECMDLETLDIDHICSDDEWITEEDTTHHNANEEWINVFGASSSHGPNGGADGRHDDFFELIVMLDENNVLVQAFRMANERFNASSMQPVRLRLIVIYTIEFQKRGLPHCHALVFLHPNDKITTTDKIDQFISAELPSELNDPCDFEAVRTHMMHGPCGQLSPSSPCMYNGRCSKGYPKTYYDETFIKHDGWPCYRRSNNGAKVQVGRHDIMLDNRFVVPHNRDLLVKYGCHINVEWCNQGMLVKYLFSYLNKGPDQAIVLLEGQNSRTPFSSLLNQVDEIEECVNCRYISASEACWKLFAFDMHYRSVPFERLLFHEESRNTVYFRDNDQLESVVQRPTDAMSKFTEWMVANQKFPEGRSFYVYRVPHQVHMA